ncbi:hypothetical protein CARUB_v10020866mg [Capsella rubella]|uniref:Uncharacterized protein n=1 Tax=Capsella rubella TaxID=81985 RepID=R0GCH7_9BRAS|nr:uncharacterized protein LOC17895421 [Capsella rubella]EOA33442.1 hypothetical protein CARUB_v10020866mg [Capsella rubella]
MLPFTNYYVSSPSMSEKNVSNNNGNKRRKKKKPTMTVYDGGGGDDLAVVKAAAWAWYLRKEDKPMMREFDITRASRTPRPTRYKIEATKNLILSENRVLAENRFSSKSPLWYTNYSSFRGDQETQYSRLLDTYEIKNISKRLNIDDTSFSVSSSNGLWHDGDDHHHNHTNNTTNNDKSYNGGFLKKVSKRSLWKGMIVMSPGSTVCGRSDDVASQAGRRTVKVAAAAEALVRSAGSGKSQSGRR